MAHAQPPVGLTARHRSQSDSDLLTPKSDRNGVFRMEQRDTSLDDMDGERKRRSFFYRLVRPWKWGRPFKKKGGKEGEEREGERREGRGWGALAMAL